MDGPGPIDAAESAVIEANAVARGIGLDVLMERAGRAVAEEALARGGPGVLIAVLAGPGNNGGDGAVAAHYLVPLGAPVELWEISAGTHRSPHAQRAFDRARRELPFHTGPPNAAELAPFGLVVDAMLGVGHRGPLRGPIRSAVDAAVASGRPILAVDTPTGFEDPAGVRASWTVALTAAHREVPSDRSGTTLVRDLGIPPAAWTETGPGDFLRFESRAPGPGGSRGGRVLVIGGGPYAGAPALAALAALRVGAERATILAPQSVVPALQGYSMDLVVRALGGTHFAPEFLAGARAELRAGPLAAVVLGPGAGAHPETLAFFRELWVGLPDELGVVIDADALGALPSAGGGFRFAARRVATPNAGEFRRLAEAAGATVDGDWPEAVGALAARLGVTVVRKGAVDEIADGNRSWTNRHHPPEQAVAGAGDVLAGMIGGLMARGIPAVGAARLATYWAGAAGHRAVARVGPGLLASDLLEEIGPAGLEGRRRGAASG